MLPCVLKDRVIRFSRQIIRPGASVVVGVSGGSDSTALLFLLAGIRDKLGISDLVVAHLNHSLRGEDSDKDELLVREHADKLGLRFYTKRLSGYNIGDSGLEAAVRRERYLFFEEVRKASGCSIVATGHTMDDQAETVLMRLMRGCGLAGLRGIVPVREDGIVRPLLGVRRQELIEWLRERNVSYRNDCSNNDLHFMRNRIRHILIPQLESMQPGVVEKLVALAEEAAIQWESGRKRTAGWIEENFLPLRPESFSIKRQGFEERSLAAEGLREIFAKYGISLSRRHIDSVIEKANCSRAGTLLLPGGWNYRYCRESLIFEKNIPVIDYKIPIPGCCTIREEGRRITATVESCLPEKLDCGKSTVYIDGGKLDDFCFYRTVKPEDDFIPFGTKREVNILKFLAKQGIPKLKRVRTACLVDGDNKVIWIPEIRMDERFRITNAAKRIIKLQSESIY